MEKRKVFLDTDVIIASLLSSKGASYRVLIHPGIRNVISNIIAKEVREVAKRQGIDVDKQQRVLHILRTVVLKTTKQRLRKTYTRYVFDEEDSHVVAGAAIAKTPFLLTHNLRHYNREKIKRDFNIIVMRPGEFLQFLRSQR